MPFESGGRSDKLGNRYEFNWIVLKFIDIISEKIEAVKIEAIGENIRMGIQKPNNVKGEMLVKNTGHFLIYIRKVF